MYNNSFPIQTSRSHHPKPQKQRHTTHTHQHKNGPHSLTMEKKPRTSPTYLDAPTMWPSALTTPSTTGSYTHTPHNRLIHTIRGLQTHMPRLQQSVGQIGRSFLARYKEHKRAFRHNSYTSKFAQHLNEYAHSFGTIHDTMQILQYHKKSTHLNTIEHYYIHAEFTANVCFAPQIRTRHPEHRSTLHSTTISLIKKPN